MVPLEILSDEIPRKSCSQRVLRRSGLGTWAWRRREGQGAALPGLCPRLHTATVSFHLHMPLVLRTPAHWEAAVDALSGHRPAVAFPALRPFSLTHPQVLGPTMSCTHPIAAPHPGPAQHDICARTSQSWDGVCAATWPREMGCVHLAHGLSGSLDRAGISLPGALTRPTQMSPRSWTAQRAD